MPHLAMASRWPRVCGRLHVDAGRCVTATATPPARQPQRRPASVRGRQSIRADAVSLLGPYTGGDCSARTPAETDLSAAM